MNGINPQAYLTDIIGRIADYPIHKIDDQICSNTPSRGRWLALTLDRLFDHLIALVAVGL
jgi:hypothetical protein